MIIPGRRWRWACLSLVRSLNLKFELIVTLTQVHSVILNDFLPQQRDLHPTLGQVKVGGRINCCCFLFIVHLYLFCNLTFFISFYFALSEMMWNEMIPWLIWCYFCHSLNFYTTTRIFQASKPHNHQYLCVFHSHRCIGAQTQRKLQTGKDLS